MNFTVPDMTCGHCRSAIKEAIAQAGGTAQVDLARKQVQVEGLDATAAEAAIRGAGYAPEPA